MKKKIVSWVIEVEWEDGTFEKIADVSDLTAQYVDGYLACVEDERNGENE
jgi:hypothetical protein